MIDNASVINALLEFPCISLVELEVFFGEQVDDVLCDLDHLVLDALTEKGIDHDLFL